MEPFIADFLNNSKRPKWLRILVLTVIIAAIIAICVIAGKSSPSVIGRIVCWLLVAVTLAAGVYFLVARILKGGNGQERNGAQDRE